MTADNARSGFNLAIADPGVVTLTLPPLPSMVRVGRLTASSIASLTNMTVDDIDDIKIGISEIITMLIQHGDGSPVTLCFEADDQNFVVEGSTAATRLDVGGNDFALATAVLEAVAETSDVTFNDGRIVIRLMKAVAVGAAER